VTAWSAMDGYRHRGETCPFISIPNVCLYRSLFAITPQFWKYCLWRWLLHLSTLCFFLCYFFCDVNLSVL